MERFNLGTDAAALLAVGNAYITLKSANQNDLVAAYGSRSSRLVQMKRRYDPTNLFQMNQNVRQA